MDSLLNVLKSPRFQSALIGAILGAVSTFALSYWGIHLDFSSVTADLQASEAAVEATPLDEEEIETIEVVAE
jgi:hypothetical protein